MLTKIAIRKGLVNNMNDAAVDLLAELKALVGIPFSTVRATAHQVVLRFEDLPEGFVGEAPAFAVDMINNERVIIHDHSFMDGHLPVVE